jgi:hypothetical protein
MSSFIAVCIYCGLLTVRFLEVTIRESYIAMENQSAGKWPITAKKHVTLNYLSSTGTKRSTPVTSKPVISLYPEPVRSNQRLRRAVSLTLSNKHRGQVGSTHASS